MPSACTCGAGRSGGARPLSAFRRRVRRRRAQGPRARGARGCGIATLSAHRCSGHVVRAGFGVLEAPPRHCARTLAGNVIFDAREGSRECAGCGGRGPSLLVLYAALVAQRAALLVVEGPDAHEGEATHRPAGEGGVRDPASDGEGWIMVRGAVRMRTY